MIDGRTNASQHLTLSRLIEPCVEHKRSIAEAFKTDQYVYI